MNLASSIGALTLFLAASIGAVSVAADVPNTSSQDTEFFEKHIRPLLAERCHKCHGATKQQGGLRLDERTFVFQGGDTGPAIVPGQPNESELIRAVRYEPDGYQMPPDGKLPQNAIDKLTEWVQMGAPWPQEHADGPETNGSPDEFNLQQRAEHWSFQPLRRPPVPEVQDSDWCRNPLDRFLLSKFEEQTIAPASEADRRTWLRRISFDVIGLPPTPEEVEAFVNDASPSAHAKVVERLLASPHYGERWGRHWLDLVRYAESRGHEFDYEVANPWHYRDYVIRALNDDVPYDQFVVEHIAGDLLENATKAHGLQPAGLRHELRLNPQTGGNESILATGFWFLGEWVHSPVDIRQEEADRFENMIDVYSKTFLGLTVACARCHDHKFDPITTKDYYALQGYLQNSIYRQVRFETMEHNRRVAKKLQKVRREAEEKLMPLLAELIEPVVDDLDEYLIAAHDLIKAGVEVTPMPDTSRRIDREAFTAGTLEKIEEHAWSLYLDPTILSHWTAHLLNASKDGTDPFYLWASFASGRLADIADVRKELERLWIEYPSVPAGLIPKKNEGWETHFEASDLITTSPALIRPTFPQVKFTDDPEVPVRSVIAFPKFVELDQAWADFADAPEAIKEPGATASWRSGVRAITPAFDIQSGKIHCLIRGGANIYLSVDSHILIHGPLHGSLVREHPAPDSIAWRWIELDVSRYSGHRARVEFCPRAAEEFAIAQVVQSEEAPANDDTVGNFFGAYPPPFAEEIQSPRGLARFYQQQFLNIEICCDWFFVPGGKSGMCTLVETDWAIQHPHLFGLDSAEARASLKSASARFYEQRKELWDQLKLVSATAPAMLDGSGEDEYVFIRGNWKKRGEVVPRRFLEVFGGERMPRPESGSGRLQLAEWMVDPEKTPILPRVMVNRIWQHYFGRGIVPTPDDFGHMGRPPSHPELLDWLASELVDSGWSLKHIHRLILLSSAYRMSNGGEGGRLNVEGTGSLQPSTIDFERFSCMPVKRLEGEIIRDTMLSLSGRLDERMYGRSVPVHLTPFMEGRGRPEKSGPIDGHRRRSIYLAVRRNFADPFFQAFDMPNPHSTIGLRTVSNVPAQALSLMNNPMVIEQSEHWAERLLQEMPQTSDEKRIQWLYAAAFSRAARKHETAAAIGFLNGQAEEYGTTSDDPRVWSDLCHVLFNSKEFLFVQ